MPRTLNASLDTSLDSTITEPRLLVQLVYSTTLRLYSGWPTDQVVFSKTWVAGGVDVESYAETRAGVQTAQLYVPYSSAIMGVADYEGLFLNEGFDGQLCSMWYHDPASNKTHHLLDEGFVDDGQISPNGLGATLQIVGRISSRLRIPRGRFAAPTWNRMIVRGTVIEWQGQRYRV